MTGREAGAEIEMPARAAQAAPEKAKAVVEAPGKVAEDNTLTGEKR